MKNSIKKTLIVLTLTTIIAGCSEAPNEPNKTPHNSQSNITNTQPVHKESLSNITTKLEPPAFGGVDSINGVTSPKSGSTISVTSDKFEIAGTYVDDIKKDVAAGVIIMIDNKPFETTYGGERPDIAKALNNPKYLKSQFFASIPTSEIGKGIHEIKIRVIANDQSGYYESNWVGKIDIK